MQYYQSANLFLGEANKLLLINLLVQILLLLTVLNEDLGRNSPADLYINLLKNLLIFIPLAEDNLNLIQFKIILNFLIYLYYKIIYIDILSILYNDQYYNKIEIEKMVILHMVQVHTIVL